MSPWNPSGPWKKQFRKALMAAFPNIFQMELLFNDYFSPVSFTNLAPVAPNVNYETQIQQVINHAFMEGWLVDFVAAAHERRPHNEALTQIAAGLGQTIAGSRIDNPTGSPLEEIINDNAQFINPQMFTERLSLLQGQVCFVQIPGGGGTGFLVGPDLVLTNEHVIRRVSDNLASASDVICLFDYQTDAQGRALPRKQITRVGLDIAKWLVDDLPPSEHDWEPDLPGDAGDRELDYGLIRLAEEVGSLPVGGDTTDLEASERQRGWVDTTADAPAPAAGSLIFLLQHPEGDPLQLSVGTVKEINHAGTRLRYDANSRDGSSGSPCFNADLQLVALHHARDPQSPPQWNQAIPMKKIRAAWQANAVSVPD